MTVNARERQRRSEPAVRALAHGGGLRRTRQVDFQDRRIRPLCRPSGAINIGLWDLWPAEVPLDAITDASTGAVAFPRVQSRARLRRNELVSVRSAHAEIPSAPNEFQSNESIESTPHRVAHHHKAVRPLSSRRQFLEPSKPVQATRGHRRICREILTLGWRRPSRNVTSNRPRCERSSRPYLSARWSPCFSSIAVRAQRLASRLRLRHWRLGFPAYLSHRWQAHTHRQS
jgi:hypothetical protein